MSRISVAVVMSGEGTAHAAHVIAAHRPDVVVIVSSHQDGGCVLAESVTAALPDARLAAHLVEAELHGAGLAVERLARVRITSTVLQDLLRAGWRGRTFALALPAALSAEDAHAVAHALAHASRGSAKRWGLVAATPDLAREIICLAAGVSRNAHGAVLYQQHDQPRAPGWHAGDEPFVSAIATAAREAIAAALDGAPYRPELQGGEPRYGVIVMLRDLAGHVRGARGVLGGTKSSLVEQVVGIATALAGGCTPPLDAGELRQHLVEVTLLHAPEPVRSLDELDPARYGVIVEQGERRGMLPPRAPGIDTALEQVMSACRSAEIDLRRPFEMFRFDVDCVAEPAPAGPELFC